MDKEKAINFLTGLAAGIIVGILYAPLSGNDTRRYIATKTKESADSVKEHAAELVESGRSGFTRAQQGLKRAVTADKTVYQEAIG